ncbi:MAG: type VI secretion system-associated FHA domain protein TagH [Gammaproteobacteria bacterium]|jgi:type VI secretion system FHA domain protein
MNLILTIEKSPEGISLDRTQQVFSEEGGDIGRSESNAWMLKDPERFISSRHCSVGFENGIYYLTDCSTNGTYLNHADQPIGKGERAALEDGMRITVGDYEFSVTISSDNSASQNPAGGAIPGVSGPFATDGPAPAPPAVQSQDDDEFGLDLPLTGQSSLHEPVRITPHSEPVIPGQENILDPLKAFEQINRQRSPELPIDDPGPPVGSYQGDHAPLGEQAFTPPKVAGNEKIPEDWDRTEYGFQNQSVSGAPKFNDANGARGGAAVARRAGSGNQTSANRSGQRPVKQQGTAGKPRKQTSANQRPATPPPSRANVQAAAAKVDNDLVAAMGLDKSDFTPEQLAELNAVVGQFVRHTVEGLLKVLRARSTIKNELRMGVTTVQPRDNNPIKFSVDVDDALEHLFVRQSKGYLPPIASVNESFETILDHQMAVLAGMRAAFKSLLNKFDPVELTRQFDAQVGSGLFAGGKKVRYWEAYNKFFNDQVQDLDSSFQYLFGEEFVKAYESQLMELSIARKQSKRDD